MPSGTYVLLVHGMYAPSARGIDVAKIAAAIDARLAVGGDELIGVRGLTDWLDWWHGAPGAGPEGGNAGARR